MSLERRICFCTKPLSSEKFLSIVLKIFQILSLVGLIGYISDLIEVKTSTKLESFNLTLKMFLNIVLNLFTLYANLNLRMERWNIIRNYGLFIVGLKIYKLTSYSLSCLINIIMYIYIITDQTRRAPTSLLISDVLSEIISLIFGLALYGWMIFMGLGIIKTATLLRKSTEKVFSEVSSDCNNVNEAFDTQIMTVTDDPSQVEKL